MRYTDPFYPPHYTGQKAVHDNDRVVAQSACGRGVVIEHVPKRGYHYLVNGLLVTERAGCSQAVINRLCARILDGADPAIYRELPHIRYADDRAVAIYESQIDAGAAA